MLQILILIFYITEEFCVSYLRVCDLILLISARKHPTCCEEITVGLELPENGVNNPQERKILCELIKTV